MCVEENSLEAVVRYRRCKGIYELAGDSTMRKEKEKRGTGAFGYSSKVDGKEWK